MTDDYQLTGAGWPRPLVPAGNRNVGLPVPWVAPVQMLSQVNEGRAMATASAAVCQVCGLGYDYGDDAFGFTALQDPDGKPTIFPPLEPGDSLADLPGMDPVNDWIGFLDGAVMHGRCARLAATMCPHIRDRADLICVRVPANDATVREVDGKLRPTYSVEDAIFVPWPASRETVPTEEAA